MHFFGALALLLEGLELAQGLPDLAAEHALVADDFVGCAFRREQTGAGTAIPLGGVSQYPEPVCGRFSLSYREAERLALELGVPVESLVDYKPRYNVAPTDTHWIVRTKYEDRELLPARWGLINHWATDRKQGFKNINARAETVQRLTVPAVDPFCAVALVGCFVPQEVQNVAGSRQRQRPDDPSSDSKITQTA